MERVDQPAGHLHLAGGGLAAGAFDLQLVPSHYLVVEAQRVQRHHVVECTDRHQVLAIVEGEPADPGAAALAQRLVQEPVGVLGVAATDVVGLLVEDRVDRGGVHEVDQVDNLAAIARRGLDLVGLQDHELVLGDLVALDDLLEGHLLVLLRAHTPVLDAGSVARVHEVKVDALRLGGGEELHRHVDQSEGDGSVPDRAGRHGGGSTLARPPGNRQWSCAASRVR